jgi:hypothetical protein
MITLQIHTLYQATSILVISNEIRWPEYKYTQPAILNMRRLA